MSGVEVRIKKKTFLKFWRLKIFDVLNFVIRYWEFIIHYFLFFLFLLRPKGTKALKLLRHFLLHCIPQNRHFLLRYSHNWLFFVLYPAHSIPLAGILVSDVEPSAGKASNILLQIISCFTKLVCVFLKLRTRNLPIGR